MVILPIGEDLSSIIPGWSLQEMGNLPGGINCCECALPFGRLFAEQNPDNWAL